MLQDGERLDDLQRDGFKIIQNEKYFCFGMDAVLLCAFARVPNKARVLDLGTGNGVIPILLSARTKAACITGIEINAVCADMAKRSVRGNGLEEKVKIIEGDLCHAGELVPADSFEIVTSNPPYLERGHGLPNPDDHLASARHEIFCTLDDVVREAARALKQKGTFFLVHRPFRLVQIFGALSQYHLEPKRIRFVHPYFNREANLVLIEALKGGKPQVNVEPPLVVYKSPGVYTKELLKLYAQ